MPWCLREHASALLDREQLYIIQAGFTSLHGGHRQLSSLRAYITQAAPSSCMRVHVHVAARPARRGSCRLPPGRSACTCRLMLQWVVGGGWGRGGGMRGW